MFSGMSDEVRKVEKIMDFREDENSSRTINFFNFCYNRNKSIGINVDQMISENSDIN